MTTTQMMMTRLGRWPRVGVLALLGLALTSACAGTDPFHIYRAPNGTVVLSHVNLETPQTAAHKLTAVDWEAFNRVQQYTYVWSPGDLDEALAESANGDHPGGQGVVFSSEP